MAKCILANLPRKLGFEDPAEVALKIAIETRDFDVFAALLASIQPSPNDQMIERLLGEARRSSAIETVIIDEAVGISGTKFINHLRNGRFRLLPALTEAIHTQNHAYVADVLLADMDILDCVLPRPIEEPPTKAMPAEQTIRQCIVHDTPFLKRLLEHLRERVDLKYLNEFVAPDPLEEKESYKAQCLSLAKRLVGHAYSEERRVLDKLVSQIDPKPATAPQRSVKHVWVFGSPLLL